MIPATPRSTLFPHTTLFRTKPASCRTGGGGRRMLGLSVTNRTRGRFCPSAMETSPHAKLTAVRRDNHTRDVAKGKWRPLRRRTLPRLPDSAYPLKPTHLYTVFTVGCRCTFAKLLAIHM